MKTILQGWHFMRTLKLIIAIAIVVQGISSRDTVMIVLGVLFGGMAVANIGCCGVGGCAVDKGSTNNKAEDVEYEEVVSNK